MDRNICKKCRCDHCLIAFKGRSRTAAMVHSEIINAHNKWWLPPLGCEPRPIRMPFKMVLGADIVVEKVGNAFRYHSRHDGGDIQKAVEWRFDAYVPEDGCDCECKAEQMVSSLNSEKD